MRCVLGALILGLVAMTAAAQDAANYTTSESPFQAEYPITIGAPVELHVAVTGVRFATVTLTPTQEVKPGEPIRCEVAMAGDSVATGKATVTAVLLLEDKDGKGLERLVLDNFKVKSERPFDVKQTLRATGDNLLAAAKVYVLIEVAL
jgi:hypothetical protein